jgi:hypothetical protein
VAETEEVSDGEDHGCCDTFGVTPLPPPS